MNSILNKSYTEIPWYKFLFNGYLFEGYVDRTTKSSNHIVENNLRFRGTEITFTARVMFRSWVRLPQF